MVIYKQTGPFGRERLHVKVFKYAEQGHAFLNKQHDNSWVERPATFGGLTMPVKAGIYASAGGAWHNVKSLDACVLAHI